jgi:hypothetical protein
MSKRKLELIDALGKADAMLGQCRALIDNHARGREYKSVAEVAEQVVRHAQAAEAANQELNKILEEEWAARTGR